MPCIVPIVEGRGDIMAVPGLLRKILYHRKCWDWAIGQPKRVGELGALRKKLASFIGYARWKRIAKLS